MLTTSWTVIPLPEPFISKFILGNTDTFISETSYVSVVTTLYVCSLSEYILVKLVFGGLVDKVAIYYIATFILLN